MDYGKWVAKYSKQNRTVAAPDKTNVVSANNNHARTPVDLMVDWYNKRKEAVKKDWGAITGKDPQRNADLLMNFMMNSVLMNAGGGASMKPKRAGAPNGSRVLDVGMDGQITGDTARQLVPATQSQQLAWNQPKQLTSASGAVPALRRQIPEGYHLSKLLAKIHEKINAKGFDNTPDFSPADVDAKFKEAMKYLDRSTRTDPLYQRASEIGIKNISNDKIHNILSRLGGKYKIDWQDIPGNEDYPTISAYTGDLAHKLNDVLGHRKIIDWEGFSHAKKMLRAANKLDLELNDYPVKTSGPVFRGGSLSEAQKILDSYASRRPYKSDTFMSTSIDNDGFFLSRNRPLYIIKSKNGAYVENVSRNPQEAETIFPRNSQFRVTSLYKNQENHGIIAILKQLGIIPLTAGIEESYKIARKHFPNMLRDPNVRQD